MKTQDDCLDNSAEFQDGAQVRLYRLTQTRGKSPKLQSYWDGPYKVIYHISDVVYWTQRHTLGLLEMSSLEEGAI
jgi:hypothetical protein